MWLQRLGTVDQNIFFGFCAVVFIIVLVNIAIVIVRTRYHNPTPGQSLTFFVILSTLLICLSVLFRGVQPSWGTADAMRSVCQIFVPPTVLGYTLLSSACFIRLWLLLLAYRWDKNTVEWMGNFILWVLLIVAGAVVIVWEAAFTPNTHILQSDPEDVNNSMLAGGGHHPSNIYECRGWLRDGSRDVEQVGWSVAMSCYFALLLLMSVVAFPLFVGIPSVPVSARPSLLSTLLTAINGLFCVIAGLIVWFQYRPLGGRRVEDSNKYAIIGSLQLWMILFAGIATLVAEIVTLRTVKSSKRATEHRMASESPVISNNNRRSAKPEAVLVADHKADVVAATNNTLERPKAVPLDHTKRYSSNSTKHLCNGDDDDNVFNESPGGSIALHKGGKHWDRTHDSSSVGSRSSRSHQLPRYGGDVSGGRTSIEFSAAAAAAETGRGDDRETDADGLSHDSSNVEDLEHAAMVEEDASLSEYQNVQQQLVSTAL